MHIKPLFRQHLAKNQRENDIKISRNGIVWLKPQSAIRPHITLSILYIDAFSLSFCFYWRLFVSFFLTQPAMPAKNITKIRSI